MMRQRSEKLKNLLNDLPHGYLIDSSTLARYGIDRRLVYKYIKSGWLESVVRGLYRRPTNAFETEYELDWKTVIMSMTLMNYPIHVGGMTALSVRGYQHYLPIGGTQKVHLYADHVPTWLKRISTNAEFVVHSLNLFSAPEMGVSEIGPVQPGGTQWGPPSTVSTQIRLSDAERALFEALDMLPKDESFHNLDMVFQSLTSLRPARLQSLLAACQSVKVKRLFFVFADRHVHGWRRHLSPSDFDLGAGARALVKGGKFHSVYKISVPKDLLQTDNPEDVDGP